jgi:hypothetical protein
VSGFQLFEHSGHRKAEHLRLKIIFQLGVDAKIKRTHRVDRQVDCETVYVVFGQGHVLQERNDGELTLFEQLLSPIGIRNFQYVSVVGGVPVEPTGAFVSLSVRVRHCHRKEGALVVRLQQRLPIFRVENQEILFKELTNYRFTLLIAQEGLLVRWKGHFFAYVKTNRWG